MCVNLACMLSPVLCMQELYLRLEVAADFRPAIALGCYWILACTLLEIVLFLAMTTRQRWALARAQVTTIPHGTYGQGCSSKF